jgi:hypothetical protein
VVETSGRTWYFKKMQGNHRHIVAILMGGLRPVPRPCGGAAVAAWWRLIKTNFSIFADFTGRYVAKMTGKSVFLEKIIRIGKKRTFFFRRLFRKKCFHCSLINPEFFDFFRSDDGGIWRPPVAELNFSSNKIPDRGTDKNRKFKIRNKNLKKSRAEF